MDMQTNTGLATQQGTALIPVLSSEQYVVAVEAHAATLMLRATAQKRIADAYKVITDDNVYRMACEDMQEQNALAKDWDEERKVQTRPIDDTKSRVLEAYRNPIDTVRQGVTHLKTLIGNYIDEKERIRKKQEEDQRRQQEAARLKAAAEAEAARKAVEAAERAAAKAAADAEAARQAAERAAAEASTPEAKEQASQALEVMAATVQVAEQASQALHAAAATVELAEHTRIEAEHMPSPIVANTTPKVPGLSRPKNWRGECFSLPDLVKGIAAPLLIADMEKAGKTSISLEELRAYGQAPIALVEIKQTALNQSARALEDSLTYPGCRAVENKTIAGARR